MTKQKKIKIFESRYKQIRTRTHIKPKKLNRILSNWRYRIKPNKKIYSTFHWQQNADPNKKMVSHFFPPFSQYQNYCLEFKMRYCWSRSFCIAFRFSMHALLLPKPSTWSPWFFLSFSHFVFILYILTVKTWYSNIESSELLLIHNRFRNNATRRPKKTIRNLVFVRRNAFWYRLIVCYFLIFFFHLLFFDFLLFCYRAKWRMKSTKWSSNKKNTTMVGRKKNSWRNDDHTTAITANKSMQIYALNSNAHWNIVKNRATYDRRKKISEKKKQRTKQIKQNITN